MVVRTVTVAAAASAETEVPEQKVGVAASALPVALAGGYDFGSGDRLLSVGHGCHRLSIAPTTVALHPEQFVCVCVCVCVCHGLFCLSEKVFRCRRQRRHQRTFFFPTPHAHNKGDDPAEIGMFEIDGGRSVVVWSTFVYRPLGGCGSDLGGFADRSVFVALPVGDAAQRVGDAQRALRDIRAIFARHVARQT